MIYKPELTTLAQLLNGVNGDDKSAVKSEGSDGRFESQIGYFSGMSPVLINKISFFPRVSQCHTFKRKIINMNKDKQLGVWTMSWGDVTCQEFPGNRRAMAFNCKLMLIALLGAVKSETSLLFFWSQLVTTQDHRVYIICSIHYSRYRGGNKGFRLGLNGQTLHIVQLNQAVQSNVQADEFIQTVRGFLCINLILDLRLENEHFRRGEMGNQRTKQQASWTGKSWFGDRQSRVT